MGEAVHDWADKIRAHDYSRFSWNADSEKEVARILAKYPPTRKQSAVMGLLHLAQKQVGQELQSAGFCASGWLPIPVIEYVAGFLDMPVIRVMEIASFYTMYNLEPVGKIHLQVCGTTPCWLRGSDDIFKACLDKGAGKGSTRDDGLFTTTEVECLGACVNAPVVQINEDYYEDLTYETMCAILDAFEKGEPPPPGPQISRRFAAPISGQTTLKEQEDA